MRALITGGDPVVGAGGLVLLAAWFGLLAGFIQLLPRLLPHLAATDPLDGAPLSSYWMTPLAAVIFFTAVAVTAAVALRAARLRLSVDRPVFLFGFLMWLTLTAGLHIRNDAAVVLALGLAVQTTVVARRRGQGLMRLARITLPVLAAVVFAVFAVDRLMPAWQSAGAMKRLAPAPAGATNVVLLILDTVRADALSLYGYERPTTPEIDDWARQGVTFERAFSTSPWTLPSHASMFTGQWADRLSADFHVPLDDEWPTVAEAFTKRGYATTAFVANWTYGKRIAGLGRGFAHYDDERIDLVSIMASYRWSRRLLTWARWAGGNHRSPQRRDAEMITDAFVDWLDRRPERPFFAFLNYFDAHHPYEMPPSYETRFAAKRPRYWEQSGTERDLTDERRREFRDAYDSALNFLDHEIGRLRRELSERDLLDNTLIIITSDHGEHFGERGLYTHANSLYAPLLHVPLIVVLPGRIPEGLRIDSPVSLRDLAATMTSVLPDDAEFPGGNLLRHLDPAASQAPRVLQAELRPNDRAEAGDPITRGYMTALISGPWHFIHNGDGEIELFDYVRDPLESNDVSKLEANAGIVEFFRSAADSIRQSQSDVQPPNP